MIKGMNMLFVWIDWVIDWSGIWLMGEKMFY